MYSCRLKNQPQKSISERPDECVSLNLCAISQNHTHLVWFVGSESIRFGKLHDTVHDKLGIMPNTEIMHSL
jgi:hypothetical protein